jgi:hypothetical protein
MEVIMECRRHSRGLMHRFLLRLLVYLNVRRLVKPGMADRRTSILRVLRRLLVFNSRCRLDLGDRHPDRWPLGLCLRLDLHLRSSNRDLRDMLDGGEGRGGLYLKGCANR